MRATRHLILTALLMGLALKAAQATPSTAVWTPCVIDFQASGTWHLGIDNYFTVTSNNGESFPTDLGLTGGAKLGKKAQVEFGVDLLEPSDDPLYFNAKVGYTENVLSKNAPALELGFANFGTKSGVTNQNIIYLVTGKTLPAIKGRLHAGYYVGNDKVLRSSTGAKENSGFMVAYDHWIKKDKVLLLADYASGKNAFGGGGVGISYSFTPNLGLLTGPVWFNDKGINGKMKWTTQLDVNF
jgi:hypothetical protein